MGVFKSKWVLTANTVLLKIYKKFSVTRIAKITHEQIFFFTYLFHVQRKKYSWCSTYRSHLTILLIFFLFVWLKYLIFYISKDMFLHYLYVVLFYNFDYLEQYTWECFNTPSGFHFETKSPISRSDVFTCLYYWMKVTKCFFYYFLIKTSCNQVT